MGFREQLRKRPRTIGGILGIVIVACAVASVKQLQSGGKPPYPPFHEQAFYTTDEGVTLFADAVSKFPPIDHDGVGAVRAYVFTCDGGKHQWVQYLEKYDDHDKKLLDARSPDAESALPLVKRPGKGDWVGQRAPGGGDITTPKCPDGMGNGPIEPVYP